MTQQLKKNSRCHPPRNQREVEAVTLKVQLLDSAKKVHNHADTKKSIRDKAPARVKRFEVAKLCKEVSEESTSETNERELFQEEILAKWKD